MKRSEKNDFVQNLKEELNNSTSLIVSHYAGLNVKEIDELRKAMRDNKTKFKVTKNRLAKLALVDTQYENIIDLFSGPTAVAYSTDPVAPAKVSAVSVTSLSLRSSSFVRVKNVVAIMHPYN